MNDQDGPIGPAIRRCAKHFRRHRRLRARRCPDRHFTGAPGYPDEFAQSDGRDVCPYLRGHLRHTNVCEALGKYQKDTGMFPTTEQELAALLQRPANLPTFQRWDGPYIEGPHVPLDPWGEEYIYKAPGPNGKPFEIISPGLQRLEAKAGSGGQATQR